MAGCVPDLINALDEAIGTIQRLSELGPAIDGDASYFPHAVELLSLIAQHAGHLEQLSAQLARCVLPRTRRAEEAGRG